MRPTFVAKPFDLDDFQARIEAVLPGSEALQRTLPNPPEPGDNDKHRDSQRSFTYRLAWCNRAMSRAVEEANRRLLRARDAMDRTYAQPLDIPALARIAFVSEAHFIRTFRATFGETPHRYLQRRRSSARCSCCARPTAA